MEVPVLIVGCGPAGGMLALHLARLGIHALVVSRYKSTANTPRAHLQNARAMEVFRDAGIEERLIKISHPAETIKHTSWIHSFYGEEYGRTYAWGNRPERKGEYELASPCCMWELSQMKLEPVLVEESTRLGTEFRFDTEFLSQVTQADGRVQATLLDRASNKTYIVTSQYLIGADGARSTVLASAGIPVDGEQLGEAFMVHVRADLSRFVSNRPGSLTWVLNPDSPDWPAVANFRMVEPWNEYSVGMMAHLRPGDDPGRFRADILKSLHGSIGDSHLPAEDQVPIEVLSVGTWTVNDQVARKYQSGAVLCIGDAVHRHPPANGLGSNTCVSDAFNLAWKLAYVLRGTASPSILDSLTAERKPVGDDVVRRANKSLRIHGRIWELLGVTLESRAAWVKVMKESSPEGIEARRKFRGLIAETEYEVQALGMNMNQMYTGPGSLTVVEDGDTLPTFEGVDPELEQLCSTYPGFALPHVWLTQNACGPTLSTLDIVGNGRFTILTGVGGQAWKDAAAKIAKKGKIDLVAHSIGFHQDYHDAYSQWEAKREVSDEGCILVRPDRFVAWRFHGLVDDPAAKLDSVLMRILGWSNGINFTQK
jgi:2-polyprenyl-6-methoxyphenol hydroxylase-like FAD-dependent oxidoreductase